MGRDVPGSNWHSYPSDPEGHTNEIYYGIEQIGWNLRSKPSENIQRGFRVRPELPQISEYEELENFKAHGVDLESGHRHLEEGSVRLRRRRCLARTAVQRSSVLVRSGSFIEDMKKALDFYTNAFGLRISEEVIYNGHRCVFLRCNTEHHSLALYPVALREELGLSPHTTCMSFGNQLGGYDQLRNAVDYLKENGVTVKYLPPELFPGIDYSAFAVDPDNHLVQTLLLHGAGWLGQPRSLHVRSAR